MIEPVDMEIIDKDNKKEEEFDSNAVYLYNGSNNPDPEYATEGASGMDLRAELSLINTDFLFNAMLSNESLIINPGGRALIPTGLHFALPQGLEFQVRPRSGLALKYGVTVLNTPGTIDSDFRGDVGVILVNHGIDPFVVKTGDRIAQLVLMGYAKILRYAKIDKLENLPSSERMQGGFGSTGIK